MPLSRPKRWEKLLSEAEDLQAQLEEKMEELRSIQEEYQDWLDNLPEGLDQSPTAEKLQAVCDADLDSPASELEMALADLRDIELPLGFGRD